MASFAANKSALQAASSAQRCGGPSAIASRPLRVQRYNGCSTAFSGGVDGARLQQAVARCVRINT